MLFTNSELLGSDNLYAIALSSDKRRVAYVSYGYCVKENVLPWDCCFISNMRNVASFIPDKDIFYVDMRFITDNKDNLHPVADNVQTIRIGEVNYYLVPVYAYNHSSICLSLSPYSDKWDSGLGGILLIKEDACSIDDVISTAQSFLRDFQLYLDANIFNVDIFSADNQEEMVDCTIDIIEPSRLCVYLNSIGFPCDPEDIFLKDDISDKIKAVYTLEV